MNNRIGQRVGNYRFLQLLGQGGFAEVYLGEHIFLKTLAAIKILQIKFAQDELESFLNEARIFASLVHPNIVRILDFGIESSYRTRDFVGTTHQQEMSRFDGDIGTPFLVMAYAPNGNLHKYFPKSIPNPASEIAKYVKQVAAALQYAHEKRLIHRDIKPENMLLGSHNEVLLSDFGIAVVTQSSRLQTVEEIVGTVSYMAPEQIQGKPSFASDQYALGVVTYEWLCGERPFHGTFTELFSQHMYASPPPLRHKVPEISPEVEQVVMKALAKDPHQRFESIREFAIALEHACRSTILSLSADSTSNSQVFSQQTPSLHLQDLISATIPPNYSLIGYSAAPVSPQYTHYNRTFSKERKPPQSTTRERTAQLMRARPCEIAACQQLLPSEQSSDDPWCQAIVCRCDLEKSDRLSNCAVPLDRR